MKHNWVLYTINLSRCISLRAPATVSWSSEIATAVASAFTELKRENKIKLKQRKGYRCNTSEKKMEEILPCHGRHWAHYLGSAGLIKYRFEAAFGNDRLTYLWFTYTVNVRNMSSMSFAATKGSGEVLRLLNAKRRHQWQHDTTSIAQLLCPW